MIATFVVVYIRVWLSTFVVVYIRVGPGRLEERCIRDSGALRGN